MAFILESMIWYLLAIPLLLLAFYVMWRRGSVRRGIAQRDEVILDRLDPLAEKLNAKESVLPDEVREVGSALENRPLLFEMLGYFERHDLFPREWQSREEQARAMLSYWLLHPNELQAAPVEVEAIENMECVVKGESGVFEVLRYRMAEGHWAGTEWRIGVVGPFCEGEPPFSTVAMAFSGAAPEGSISGAEAVDEFVGIVEAIT